MSYTIFTYYAGLLQGHYIVTGLNSPVQFCERGGYTLREIGMRERGREEEGRGS